jgi:Zn ribbon nucleic-acid-binding protein|tara:strand:- start:480 stop:689 length:210 start_codon:yes stop_codon:yes gene_type:complete
MMARHKWIDKTTEGAGEDKVDTATCEKCGLQKKTHREMDDNNEKVHVTTFDNNGSVTSSRDGAKTPECC